MNPNIRKRRRRTTQPFIIGPVNGYSAEMLLKTSVLK